MPDMKPGYKTTEYWLTVVATLVSLLGATGVIGPSDTSTLAALGKDVILGGVALVSIVSYVAGRMKLKGGGS